MEGSGEKVGGAGAPGGSLSGASVQSVLAEEPAVEEVVAFVEGRDGQAPPCKIDVEWARDWHRYLTSIHGWVKNGRVIRWRTEIATWWQRQRPEWEARKLKNAAGGAVGPSPGVPVWRQIKDLEAAIEGHVANAGTQFYRRDLATPEKKAELCGLRKALEDLKKGAAPG